MHHWIKTGQLDRAVDETAVQYGPRPRPPSILNPYKALIRTRLAEYPKLTAKRLFEEAKAAGYPGSYNVVKRYVRLVRPKAPDDPVVRFGTPDGHDRPFLPRRVPVEISPLYWTFPSSSVGGLLDTGPLKIPSTKEVRDVSIYGFWPGFHCLYLTNHWLV